MLIRFLVKNYLSFNEEVEFSMIPGKVKSHDHHKIKGKGRHDLSVLRAGLIYGANASGKSNLIKAMAFAAQLITKGTRARASIDVTPFKLNSQNMTQPSKFEFWFKYEEVGYIYGFEADTHRIHSEWLYKIGAKDKHKLIFERTTTVEGETAVEFDNIKYDIEEDKQFLKFVARGTRPNQLFLTESLEKNVKYFANAYLWFVNTLRFVLPTSQFMTLVLKLKEDNQFKQDLANYLKAFDTGITDIALQEINFPEDLNVPQEILQDIIENLKPGTASNLIAISERYVITVNENNEVQAFKLMIEHPMNDSDKNTLFEIAEESDGTQRLLDLIPLLTHLLFQDKVCIIDELDRSLHPNLSRKILEIFLNTSTSSKGQLIATTHQPALLDLENLLRRDEIWFMQKKQGASTLYSLEEFLTRNDMDIEKRYLLGRFGAVPHISRILDEA